jgi:hypothetical protein
LKTTNENNNEVIETSSITNAPQDIAIVEDIQMVQDIALVEDIQMVEDNSRHRPVDIDSVESQNLSSILDSQNIGSSDTASNDRRLKNIISRLRRRLAREKKRNTNLKMNLKRFLNDDQIQCLELRSRKAARWSNPTVKKALQIRCATGTLGYNHLLKQGFPLPSYRTLCSKVEAAQFSPGLQRDVLDWLKMKLEFQPPMGRDCVLAWDEMQIRPIVEFDRGRHVHLSLQ